jgi:hypothetical protein
MQVLALLLLLVLANISFAQTPARDIHFTEAGSSAVFLRSAFAHGYRHGYEEGYHLGNIDVNMGRHARAKLSDVKASASHYSAEFGPRKSFESGFQEGLKAGYSDGYVGRSFRAIENLRFIALALDNNAGSADPGNTYFDQGFSTGYTSGLDLAQKDAPAATKLDVRFIGCDQFRPAKQQDVAAEANYCDGYRRGYVLGHADGIVLRPEAAALAARR